MKLVQLAIAGLTLGLGGLTAGLASGAELEEVRVLEALTQRCSGDVVVVPRFYDSPYKDAGIYLKRNERGFTEWSDYLQVDAPRVLWYCHEGDPFPWLEPGTWAASVVRERCLQHNPAPDPTQGPGGFRHPCDRYHLYTDPLDGWIHKQADCPEGTAEVRVYLRQGGGVRINCYAPAPQGEGED